MNNYFNELKQLVYNNPNGYATILKNKKKYLLTWIYQKTQFTKNFNLKLNTLVYLVLNNYNDFPKCCICKKPITKNIFSIFMGYNQHNCKNIHCSYECAKKDPDRTKKYHDTCLKKYGVDSPTKTKEQKEKSANTKLLKYGNKNFNNREKCKQTVFKKYGVEYVSQLDIFKQKALKTTQEKFNTNHVCIPRYKFNNIYFDSSWQLAFYLYYVDHNIKIERNVKQFIYYDKNLKKHIYHPDFYLPQTNQFIEIKGKLYFLKMSQQLKQCIKKNNIKLLFYEDLKLYLKYLKENYKYYKKYEVKELKNNE